MKLKAGERIDELYSLGVKVIQNSRVAAFSNDAVLLAYFTRMRRNPRSITVDLCSGNGAIGMFVSRKTKGKVLEIEIQPKLVEMAKRSVLLNHLSRQIRVIQTDLSQAGRFIPLGTVDVVTCNPPYFSGTVTDQQNINPYLAIARHEVKTNLTAVIKTISSLLKNHGHAFLVYRPGRLLEMLNKMLNFNLAPKQLQFVYSHLNSTANLVLVDASKNGKWSGLRVLPPIIIRNCDDSGYSLQMKKIMFQHWNS